MSELDKKEQCADCGCELPETTMRLVYLDNVGEVTIPHTEERCRQYFFQSMKEMQT